ncbi:hypothetical protein QBC46DRAFT_337842 [Diplogelasinospora grovesii]|uniref:Uncharacterized protein n=1 Tax=Diplogelasinospora grovesii TaxID=303347 RepID=A0AAN6NE45_9PEZI|nr:hypothetical protein QBC46DRAFT_337842 [Diplogelasinospora grovesii]
MAGHMGSVVPKSPTLESLRGRDTGFPEAFCGNRNTSLPHPEANLAPDACITEEDITPVKAELRLKRMSFEATKSRHNRMYSDSSLPADGGIMSAIGKLALSSLNGAELAKHLGDNSRLSKDADSLASIDGTGSGGSSPVRPKDLSQTTAPELGDGDDPREGRSRRRSSVLRRLMHR